MQITLGPGVTVTQERVVNSDVFRHWADRHGLDGEGEITIIDVDDWGDKVQTIYMSVEAAGDRWASRHVLRSPTVDVLTIITDGRDAGWAVFVRQYRHAIGEHVISNVAGGRDWAEDAHDAALREFLEELGLEDMFAPDERKPGMSITGRLQVEHAGANITAAVRIELLTGKQILASPGITNEEVDMFKATITVPPDMLDAFLDALDGKRTGVAAEGEDITVFYMPVAHLRRGFFYSPDSGERIDGKLLDSLGLAGHL